MALMYPWATKEYLLWEMTIGQIVLYHNMGNDIKAGKKEKGSLARKSADELRKFRDDMFKDPQHDLMQQRYGEIDGN